jgi:hypothetical protein
MVMADIVDMAILIIRILTRIRTLIRISILTHIRTPLIRMQEVIGTLFIITDLRHQLLRPIPQALVDLYPLQDLKLKAEADLVMLELI